jgi:hypothetical protein
MLKELIKLANELDQKGFGEHASRLDSILAENKNELGKFAGIDGIEIPAEEAMAHEEHSPIEETSGFADFEAEEQYKSDLAKATKVAEAVILGGPVFGEDADNMIQDLAAVLNTEEHTLTVDAIIKELNKYN